MSGAIEQRQFSSPRRQARAGLWIEGFHELQRAYKIVGLYVLYALFRFDDKGISLMIAAAGLVAFFAFGFLRYRNVLFYIDAETNEFIFQEAVFVKRKTVLHMDRIQQVNISRNFLQKLFHVYSLTISSAGSKETEIKIKAISLTDARVLRSRLLNESYDKSEDGPHADPPHGYRIPNMAIFLVAATSRYGKSFALLFAVGGALYNLLQDFFRVQRPGSEDREMARLIEQMLTSVWTLVIFLFVVWILFNIISGIIRFYNYEVTFIRNAIQVEFGAIKTNHVIIYRDKVQVIETISNYFLKRLNLRRLIIKQASADFHADKTAAVELPGCTPSQQKQILSDFFAQLPEVQKTIFPNYRKFFRPLINVVLIPLLIVLIFARDWPYLVPFFGVWTLIVSLLSYFSWKHSKLLIAPDFIKFQKGAWDVSTSMMQSHKIQGVRITQRLWHRRAGIAHLTLYTASDNLYFSFVKLEEINPYINQWLYDAESTNENWM